MASGPIRAAIGKEKIYETIGRKEQPNITIGLLEANKLPPETVCRELAALTGGGKESRVECIKVKVCLFKKL